MRFEPGQGNVSQVKAHTATIRSIAFLPDGSRFLSASFDGTVKVWHAETGEQALVLPADFEGVNAVAVSPDGWKIATGGAAHHITLWDATPRR